MLLRHPYNFTSVAFSRKLKFKKILTDRMESSNYESLLTFLSLVLFATLKSGCVPKKSEIDYEIERIKDFWYFFTINEAGRFPWPRQYVCIFPHFNNISTMSRPSLSFHLFSFIIAWSNESREEKMLEMAQTTASQCKIMKDRHFRACFYFVSANCFCLCQTSCAQPYSGKIP